jgi:crotonobetainyl-CoA:carnitine CoA-transferase CaiB-like acyl-CoA transferase
MGYDVIVGSASSWMELTEYPEQEPAKLGSSFANIISRAYAFQGFLLALMVRQRTGKEQAVDISRNARGWVATFWAGTTAKSSDRWVSVIARSPAVQRRT